MCSPKPDRIYFHKYYKMLIFLILFDFTLFGPFQMGLDHSKFCAQDSPMGRGPQVKAPPTKGEGSQESILALKGINN